MRSEDMHAIRQAHTFHVVPIDFCAQGGTNDISSQQVRNNYKVEVSLIHLKRNPLGAARSSRSLSRSSLGIIRNQTIKPRAI